MVERYEQSEDGLIWRFTLRDGLMFHDGEKVRAPDAIASIARWSQRDQLGAILKSRLAGMRARNDR